MKIRVIWVGKTKNPNLAAVCKDLGARIRHFLGLELVEAREPRVKDDRKRIAIEGEKVLSKLDPSDWVVGLDPKGQAYSSDAFAQLIGRHMRENPNPLVFVVGGPAGLSDGVRQRSNVLCSLSGLTLSHDLARTVLLEQIYRALTMIRNLPYAK